MVSKWASTLFLFPGKVKLGIDDQEHIKILLCDGTEVDEEDIFKAVCDDGTLFIFQVSSSSHQSQYNVHDKS